MIQTIFVVEDDKGLQKYLKELLLDNGYAVRIVADSIAALSYFETVSPDLILLDLDHPFMNGEVVCQEVRKKNKDLPIILLTEKGEVTDIVQGFNLGADDYIVKPFIPDEFLARIKARLRKQNGVTLLTISDLELNTETLEVKRDGKLIQLTPQEYKLLHYLMSNTGGILTREMILSRIWLYSSEVETRVVDVYVGYLRKKIDNGFRKKLLFSVRGFGYVIKE